MKTTFDLPEELFHRAKKAALERRTSLKAIVIEALERELGPEQGDVPPLRTPVWPPAGRVKAVVDSETILQMIRSERDSGVTRNIESASAMRDDVDPNGKSMGNRKRPK